MPIYAYIHVYIEIDMCMHTDTGWRKYSEFTKVVSSYLLKN